MVGAILLDCRGSKQTVQQENSKCQMTTIGFIHPHFHSPPPTQIRIDNPKKTDIK